MPKPLNTLASHRARLGNDNSYPASERKTHCRTTKNCLRSTGNGETDRHRCAQHLPSLPHTPNGSLLDRRGWAAGLPGSPAPEIERKCKELEASNSWRNPEAMRLQKINDSQLSRFSSQKHAASNIKRPASPNGFNKCANPSNNNPNPDSAIPATEVMTSVSSSKGFGLSECLFHNS